MTDPWLVQSVQKNGHQEFNERTLTLQNGKAEDIKILEQDNHQDENKQNLQFEDNFAPTLASNNKNQPQVVIEKNRNGETTHQPLADSAAYLEGLEIKLEKLRKGSKLVESLSAKREDCMRTLLLDDFTATLGQHNELDEAISNGDSAVHEIYRHLQPVQAVTVGELVHILKHDQLTDNDDNEEEEEEGEQTTGAVIEEQI